MLRGTASSLREANLEIVDQDFTHTDVRSALKTD